MVVVTSILNNPARSSPEGKIALPASQRSAPASPLPPAYSSYSSASTSCDSEQIFQTYDADSSSCTSTSSSDSTSGESDPFDAVAVPVPFPPRRPKIPHNRSTMVPVRRYVQKSPYMVYDLARVRALWVHEEQTMQYFHGTPAHPHKDCNEELHHNCRHCSMPPSFFQQHQQQRGSGSKSDLNYELPRAHDGHDSDDDEMDCQMIEIDGDLDGSAADYVHDMMAVDYADL